jgi:GNAT superfamily N-acetyltransferase
VTVEVVRSAGTDPVALELVEAMLAETADPGVDPGIEALPEQLSPPEGGYVVLSERGRAVGGGGVRRLADGVCEIKRMYVVPDARGRGLGRRLHAELEALARDLGYGVARLDTGARQPRAQRMYERAGYASIPDYNGSPGVAFWGEKRLIADAATPRAEDPPAS